MKIGVREAAAFLNQPETTIYRWIKDGTLPAHKMSDRYWFNRAELLEWATAQGLAVSPEMFQDPATRAPLPASIAEILGRGGVHYGVPGSTKEDVLQAIVERLPLPEDADRECMLQMLLAREAQGSTGVGDGIALPHVRSPIVPDEVDEPMIALCFLERPIDYGAIDERPVHTVFTLMTPTVRAHLHILSRLAFLLRDATFSEALKKREPAEILLELARSIEERREADRSKRSSPSIAS
jgi:PTS system nitrogen regulatory IIA component